MMNSDPIVEEVRRIRDELARKFNYDLQSIGQDLMARQGKTLSPEQLAAIRATRTPSPAPLAVREHLNNDYNT
jgi:hypothetical protein